MSDLPLTDAMPLRSRWISAFALLATLAGPGVAMGNSTRFTANGRPFRWTTPAFTLRYAPSNLAAVTGDTDEAVRGAALAWSLVPKATRIQVVGEGATGVAGYTPGAPSSCELIFFQRNYPVSTNSLAVTVVSSSADTGEILDADVLVQGTRYRFEQLGPQGLLALPGTPYDLQSMLTHEFGHVLGLGEDYATGDATMFPTATPGAVTQRSLTMTDIDSLSRAYAIDAADPSGCALRVAPRGPRSTALLSVLGFCAFVCARRRSNACTRWLSVSSATLMLVWAVPAPSTDGPSEATVLTTRAHSVAGQIFTSATIEQQGQTREVTLPGGVWGSLRQDVLDAPSGSDLTPGARVTLDGQNVLRVSVPFELRARSPQVAQPEE